MKPHFRKKLTPEFLFVDLLNNLDALAENRDSVLNQVRKKLPIFDPKRLQQAIDLYGNMATRKRIRGWLGD